VAAVGLAHASIGTLFPALPAQIKELNAGVIALAVNVAALVAVSGAAKLMSAGAAPPSRSWPES
jgi:solute:Na+ symporter, SSS family